MVTKGERIVSEALRRVLEPLSVGVRIEDSDGLREALRALERFLSAVLEATYLNEWRYESLDGLLVGQAFKTEPRTAEIAGMCVLITDQTVTPFHLRLRVAEAADEIEWGHFRLGELIEDGLLRVPYLATTWHKRMHALDVSAIKWAYEVDLHGWCGGP